MRKYHLFGGFHVAQENAEAPRCARLVEKEIRGGRRAIGAGAKRAARNVRPRGEKAVAAQSKKCCRKRARAIRLANREG